MEVLPNRLTSHRDSVQQILGDACGCCVAVGRHQLRRFGRSLA